MSTPDNASADMHAGKFILCGGVLNWWRIKRAISPRYTSAGPNGVATVFFSSSGISAYNRLVPPKIPSIDCFSPFIIVGFYRALKNPEEPEKVNGSFVTDFFVI